LGSKLTVAVAAGGAGTGARLPVEVARQDGLASSVVSKAGAGGPTLMLNGHVDRAWRFYNATTWAIFAIRDNGRVALQRMDNVGIVVESLDAAISFFVELGLELEGRAMIEGDWSGRVTGLRDQRVEIAMMRMPDGHGKIELSRFLTPPPVADHRNAPVNALGYLRVMFAVDDLDETLARLREHGAQLVDEVVQYKDVYRLCYIRGPEGILIGLAEQIG
jgi:catechol 2,3-dioxygenase-like lactoylglutathione lyase family enzyme